MVICIGDSLTYGSVGYSYLQYMSPKYRCVNMGVNGDSLYGAQKRLEKCLKNKRYQDAGMYIIAIGTNDVLFRYLRYRSEAWQRKYRQRDRKLHFASGTADFSARYEAMVSEIVKKGHQVLLIGLPYIELANYPLSVLEAYNRCIRRIAEKYKVAYIDFLSMEKNYMHEKRTFDWGLSYVNRILDGLYMTVFPKRRDTLTKKRKLLLTVDGVHFNSRTARLLAAKVEQTLESAAPMI